ncbi:TetR/AcrR family transcriptional regulator [Paenibacillus sp. NPDC093718]|uniref:TetR/AcrR family transcriptional regulator n=1 Tax=Paenibacillus sp. NPDC093718 TaxID=3390601 RepID=UPI003CFD0C3B
MGEIRNAERTRKRILEAARKEFFDKGYTGARIEVIAKSADVKKQLIYHYFKGKEELLVAVLDQMKAEMPDWATQLPTHPVDIAEHRFRIFSQTRMDFLRFTAWEALETQPQQDARKKRREETLQSYVEDMKLKQEAGLVSEDLDPELLTLAISALSTYPLVYGDVTKMITGYEPSDQQFQEKWSKFLTKISERIFSKDGNQEG